MGNTQSRKWSPFPLIKSLGTAITGSWVSVYTGGDSGLRVSHLLIMNSCDQTVLVSFDGSNTHIELESSEKGIFIDMGANGDFSQSGIYIKHAGVAPTSGSLRFTLFD